MPLQLRNYEPAIAYGANIDVAVDLTDITDNNGNEVIEIDGVTSAVNFLRATNSATGNAAALSAQGSDTNVGLNLSSKGTGSVTLWTGDSAREVLIGVNTASAVNEVTITPSATGNAVRLAATGTDTNVGLDLSSKGTGSVTLWTGDAARQVLVGVNVASAVNELQLSPSATGNPILLAATGDDTNVGVDIDGKGSGAVRLNQTGTGNITTPRAVLSSGATAGIGYSTGAGGTVTQATNKSTGVTLNTVTGQITMNAAALAADAIVSFTLTNSAIATNDVLLLNHHSVGTVGSYVFTAQPAAGSAVINVANRSAASLSEAIVIQYAVVKAVVA